MKRKNILPIILLILLAITLLSSCSQKTIIYEKVPGKVYYIGVITDAILIDNLSLSDGLKELEAKYKIKSVTAVNEWVLFGSQTTGLIVLVEEDSTKLSK